MPRAASLPDYDHPEADQIILFQDVTWRDYERFLEIRGDRPVPRMTYLEGVLQIMSPSKDHEQIKSFIGRLLEAWCIDRGIELTPFGSWTLKAEQEGRAAEADECYVFGTEPRQSPHLVIEVEWSRGGLDKRAVYERLGVDELWVWRKNVIEVFVMTDGSFLRAERSRLLPDLDIRLLASMLDRETLTRAVRDFRNACGSES